MSEILRNGAWRCSEAAHALVKRRSWVGTRLRVLQLLPKVSIEVRYAVQVEVVDIEDVGEVVQVIGHLSHGVDLVRLRPRLLLSGGVHGSV